MKTFTVTNFKLSVNTVVFFLTAFIIITSITYALTSNTVNMKFLEHIFIAIILIILTNSTRTPKHLQSILGVGSLLVSATILIALTEGSYATQLIFPVVLVTVTFYRDYFAYGLAVLYIALFYYLTTFLDPLLLYPPTILALGVPYAWAVSVVAFSILASMLGIIFWKINDKAFLDRQKLAVALAESSLKQRQALDIHDNIVQGLVVAKYALDLKEYDNANQAIKSTLTSAKNLIGSLSTDNVSSDPLLRYDPSEKIFSETTDTELSERKD